VVSKKGPLPPTKPWILAPGDQSPAPWSDEIAQIILGKYAIVNVTYMDSDWQTIKSRAQYHGLIVEASPKTGIVIECQGLWAGETMTLPPILCFLPAEPGVYRLESTGEEIEDPDLTSEWSLVE
jgi:hypothetical protein